MKKVSLNKVKAAVKGIGAPIFEGELNVTLVGIRSNDTKSNSFNDLLCVIYEKDGKQVMAQYSCTTDPGTYYRLNPINVNGTAILKPGHYRSCWKIGAHKGMYEALVQHKRMTVYRDSNRDKKLDTDASEETGVFGLNLHKASFSGYSLQVDKWSAGCQVLASSADYSELMDLLKQSANQYGESFSYTLLTESQL